MKKTLLISSSLTCLLLLTLFLASCSGSGGSGGTTSSATPTRASTPKPVSTVASTPTQASAATTPTTSTVPAGFLAFNNSSFSLNYPHDWTQKQNGNNYSFSRDVITQFVVGLHNKDQNPQSVINDLTNSVMTCTQNKQVSSSVTPNSLTWQQSAWNCYLANDTYVVYILTHVNSQTNDKTVIVFADYQQVATSKLIPFDQANTQYFQPMLKSFQLK